MGSQVFYMLLRFWSSCNCSQFSWSWNYFVFDARSTPDLTPCYNILFWIFHLIHVLQCSREKDVATLLTKKVFFGGEQMPILNPTQFPPIFTVFIRSKANESWLTIQINVVLLSHLESYSSKSWMTKHSFDNFLVCIALLFIHLISRKIGA